MCETYQDSITDVFHLKQIISCKSSLSHVILSLACPLLIDSHLKKTVSVTH